MDLDGGRETGVSVVSRDAGVVRAELRSKPYGEVLFQLLLLWGVFGAGWWISVVLSSPGYALVMAVGCVWCAARSVGWCSGHVLTLAVTVPVLLATAWCSWTSSAGVPEWMLRSPVSPAVITGLLAGVLCLDYAECRKRLLGTASAMVRRRWLGFELLAGLGLIWLGWSFGAALFFHHRDLQMRGGAAEADMTSLGGRVAFHAGEGLVTFCVLVLGGNIGSFLNVLVYRLPRGLDVISSRSRCPNCGTAIASRDNVPMFGWLFLGGRCRACGVEISAEYPRVEVTSAGIFLLMYFAELLTGGLNIPFRQPNLYAGVLWTVMYPKFDLIGLWLLHVMLLTALLVYSRLQSAGHTVSLRATAILSAVVLLVSTQFPNLQPVSVTAVPGIVEGSELRVLGGGFGGLYSAVAGLLAGLSAGGLLLRLSGAVSVGVAERRSVAVSTAARSPFVAGLVLTGTVLGWQAVLGTVVVLGCLGAVISWWADREFKDVMQRCSVLLMAVILQVLIWRWQWNVLGMQG